MTSNLNQELVNDIRALLNSYRDDAFPSERDKNTIAILRRCLWAIKLK